MSGGGCQNQSEAQIAESDGEILVKRGG